MYPVPAKRVLVLGCRPESVDALRRRGAEVTCVVAPGESLPSAAVRKVRVTAHSNLEDVVGGLEREGIDLGEFDIVCSQHEFSLAAASALGGGDRSHLPMDTVIRLRDKAVQKEAVRAAGIPVAGFEVVTDLDRLESALAPGCVLKPLASSSSRNVLVVTDPEAAVEEIRHRRVPGPWLVEEFVDGAELQIDGVVRDGEIEFLAVSKYLQNLIEVRDGGLNASIVLDPADEPERYARARGLADAALRALRHRNGIFHMEVFDQPGGLVFGECAGRVSGGRTDVLLAEKFGVDLHDEWALSVLGEPSQVAPAKSEATFGDIYLTPPPGRLIEIPGEDEISARPGVVHARVMAVPGEEMPHERDASSVCAAQAVVRGKDAAEVERHLRDLARWFRSAVVTDGGRPPEPARRAPRVMVLGGRPDVIRKAAALGLDIVNVQKPSAFDPAVLEHASQVHLVDYQDVPAVETLVEALHRTDPFTRVFTQNEAAQVVCGHLTSRLGLPGNGVDVVRTLHDKPAMRARLNEHGVGPVAVQAVTTKEALRDFTVRHGASVVKPTMGSGSLGVRKIHCVEDVDEVWSWILSSGVRDFFAEQLLTGTEVSVETFSARGRHTVLAVTGKDTGDGVVELGHVVPAPLKNADLAQVGEFTRRVLDAVGLVDGLAHTEVMLTADGPRAIESHCRRGGDQINKLVRMVYGVDMETLAFRLALTADPLRAAPRGEGGAAIRFLVAEPGQVVSVEGVERATAMEGVVEVRVQVVPGDVVNPLRWSEDRCGYVLVHACDGPTAERIAGEAAELISIRTAAVPDAPDDTLAALLSDVDEVLDPFAARHAFPSRGNVESHV
ncbi:hypothetical protein GCM10010191_57010 [Actinomadura vinacea]|uniref:ATP-grasp domain-containing protein n=1 Tax=Actinomadura vinacea TaxID=115336 RepID=A0ABP5WS95_9ACTN